MNPSEENVTSGEVLLQVQDNSSIQKTTMITPEIESLQQKTKKSSMPKSLFIFNGIMIFLKVLVVIATFVICYLSFKKGGDYIWVTIVIAPAFGGIAIIVLATITLAVNAIYLFIHRKK